MRASTLLYVLDITVYPDGQNVEVTSVIESEEQALRYTCHGGNIAHN